MSSFFSKIRDKTRRHSSGPKNPQAENGEQQFSIQPHPAKTNNPVDLQPEPEQGGLASARDPASAVHSTPGPVIPNAEIQQNIPPPASHDELSARAAELNK
ncbi:hypothetical protein EW145_g7253 [Phellinidium pouzarii]|uniref:Uncharacterized protein n=1 Tax=Phellinidium pouzarii TaxID=167371 RepID=A0A4S4KMZ0_9AGAM|nr:hypothetical protein EW145_g7253 [Phellinidium pouzarii]